MRRAGHQLLLQLNGPDQGRTADDGPPDRERQKLFDGSEMRQRIQPQARRQLSADSALLIGLSLCSAAPAWLGPPCGIDVALRDDGNGEDQ